MSAQFIKRLKSFAWRFGIALITFGLSYLLDNLSALELPIWITGALALGLGEVSKWWANRQLSLGKTFLGRVL